MISASDVAMCLVTRGDQPDMMRRIFNSLLDYGEIVVWDNSGQAMPPAWWYETERRQPTTWASSEDWKCAGRYKAAECATKNVVMFQDDDVLVPEQTQVELLEAYKPGVCVANWGHGENADGYDDLPLVCGGAVVDRQLCFDAIDRYAADWPLDAAFRYEADFVVGALYPAFEHLRLPFHIDMRIAQHPSRLCNQPWQRDLKLEVTNRARAIRDLVAA